MTKSKSDFKPGLVELVVIARAAHLTNDRGMQSVAVRRIRDEFGISLTFMRERNREPIPA